MYVSETHAHSFFFTFHTRRKSSKSLKAEGRLLSERDSRALIFLTFSNPRKELQKTQAEGRLIRAARMLSDDEVEEFATVSSAYGRQWRENVRSRARRRQSGTRYLAQYPPV